MAGMASGFWSRLTPRERTYVTALVLTFFCMSVLALFYLRGNALREVEDEIDAYRRAVESVRTRGAVYDERRKAKELRESKIPSDEVSFTSLLEQAQSSLSEVDPSDQEELPSLDLGEGLVRKSFEFKLRSVSLDDLVKFLVAIESQPNRVILTDEVVIRAPSSTDDRLNVDVKLATWERRKAEEDGEDAEEEE